MKKKNPAVLLSEFITKLRAPEFNVVQEKKEIVQFLTGILEELQRSQDLDFRKIGDNVYDGIYITDGQGKTIYVNKAYERITGINAAEVLGKYVSQCEKEGLYKNAVAHTVIKNKQPINAMGESSRNGNKLLISGNPIFDDNGNVVQVVVIDRDITDLLAMKSALEESQHKIQAVEADKKKSKLELEHLRKQQLNNNLVGQSPLIKQTLQKIHQIANLDVTVLITGETGTGKEVIANEIYANSIRKNLPFIKVNCAAIPANLLESELFGYEKGSFTGASSSGRIGLFELADKGTILLDEIGEMPLELQAKLLRVIQHKEIVKIGGRKPIKLDVRILAATNCDLFALVQQGKFREDLYYRLNIFPIQAPPLRDRISDIPLLTQHFLDNYNTKYGKQTEIEPAAMKLLQQYSWPGNIRELQNIVERLVIIAEPSVAIDANQINSLLNVDAHNTDISDLNLGLKEIIEKIEKITIEKALLLHGSTRKAAKVLKIDQSTIVKKAKKLGIKITDENCHQ